MQKVDGVPAMTFWVNDGGLVGGGGVEVEFQGAALRRASGACSGADGPPDI